MKLISILFATIFLSGCWSTSPKIIVEKEYIVRIAPQNLKTLPEYPAKLDTNANQIDLANWILLSEERQWQLENMISELIKFYEAPVKK
jgi:hypothetical protein